MKENVKLVKPVVYVKFSNGVYFENGTIVFVNKQAPKKEDVFEKITSDEVTVKAYSNLNDETLKNALKNLPENSTLEVKTKPDLTSVGEKEAILTVKANEKEKEIKVKVNVTSSLALNHTPRVRMVNQPNEKTLPEVTEGYKIDWKEKLKGALKNSIYKNVEVLTVPTEDDLTKIGIKNIKFKITFTDDSIREYELGALNVTPSNASENEPKTKEIDHYIGDELTEENLKQAITNLTDQMKENEGGYYFKVLEYPKDELLKKVSKTTAKVRIVYGDATFRDVEITINVKEKPAPKELTITGFEGNDPLEIEKGADWNKEKQKLPKKVKLILSDGTKKEVDVKWYEQGINTFRPGESVIAGEITLPQGVKGSTDITLKVIVKEKKAVEEKKIVSFEKIKDFETENGKAIKTAGEDCELPKTFKAKLSDNSTIDISVKSWRGNVNFWHNESVKKTFVLEADYDLPQGITGDKIKVSLNVIVLPKVVAPKPELVLDKESYFHTENPIITLKNFPFGRPEVIVHKDTNNTTKDVTLKSPQDFDYVGGTNKSITLKTDAIFKKANKEFTKDEVLNITIKKADVSVDVTINYKKTPIVYANPTNYEFDNENLKIGMVFDDESIKNKVKFFNGQDEISILDRKQEYNKDNGTNDDYFYISKDVISGFFKDSVNGIKVVGKCENCKDFFFTITKKGIQNKEITAKAIEGEDGSTFIQKIPFCQYGQNHPMRIEVSKENGLTKEFLEKNLSVNIQSVNENSFPGTFTVSEQNGKLIVSVPTDQDLGKIIYKNLSPEETKDGYDGRFPITKLTLEIPGFEPNTVKFSVQP